VIRLWYGSTSMDVSRVDGRGPLVVTFHSIRVLSLYIP
jgi:hypothetical protein